MFKRPLLGCVIATALVSLALSAPDFSGKWVLNKDQSEMRTRDGQKPDITMTVEQTADTLKVKQESSIEFMNREYSLKLNGEPTEVPGRRGGSQKMTAAWEGDVLVVTSVREFDGNTMTSTDRWQLSADGKVLTVAGKRQTPGGDFESKMVYDKQ